MMTRTEALELLRRRLAPDEVALFEPLLADAEIIPSQRQRLDQRDAAIRELARECYPGPKTSVAKAISAEFADYLSRSFPREKAHGLPHASMKRRLLRAVAIENCGRHLSQRQILHVLNGSRGRG